MSQHPPGPAAGLLVALCLLGCRRPATPEVTRAPPATDRPSVAEPRVVELTEEGLANAGIEVTAVSPEAFAPRWTLPCAVEADPRRMARVGSRAPGRVLSVRAGLGERVRRGQVLLDLDTLEYHQVVTEYLGAVARLRAAEDQLQRHRRLVEERVGAVLDLRQAEAHHAEAAAVLHEAEEHLHNLGLTEGAIRGLRMGTSHGEARAAVRAPMDGTVAARDVVLGQVLTGSEALFVLVRTDEVRATARVPERDLARITEGQSVTVEVPAFPGRAFPGAVAVLGALLDPATRTLEAVLSLPNADGALRPGMSCVVALPIADRSTEAPAFWVPREAVQETDEGRSVFLEVGPRRFSPRAVALGPERGDRVPVLRGLSAGDRLVVRGALTLRGELERDELEEEE
ncbi:MAG: efflux RND transporter periplasmic adaptor subunit [Deltaproteobacteria bacterium]|nr:efflux RND transporter periplasmic adaptor subunit [Deltaproteobacteria bacterium]